MSVDAIEVPSDRPCVRHGGKFFGTKSRYKELTESRHNRFEVCLTTIYPVLALGMGSVSTVLSEHSVGLVEADRQVRPPSRRRLPVHDAQILVIGINYQPEPTGIAPYTTGLAEHLAGIARSVTVLTGLPHYPSWQVPDQYRGRLRRRDLVTDRMRVVRHAHYVPGRQTVFTRAGYEMTFLANVLTSPAPAPDLVLAVSPSLGGAVAGACVATRFGAPLITVVQDLMAKAAGQSGISGGGSVSGMTAKLERYALRRSTLVAPVSEAFIPPLRDYGVPADRIRVLPNWAHITPAPYDVAGARRQLGWSDDGVIALHTGNMGLKQDLGNVISAARLLRSRSDISFILLGDGSQRAALEVQAADLPNVRFVDPLTEQLYPQALAAADLFLVNERASVGDMSLPSKLTSYLSAGRPVLAAVGSDGATARELERTAGAAMRVEPGAPHALAESVTILAADARQREGMAAAGRAFADAYLGQAAAMERVTALVNEALLWPPA